MARTGIMLAYPFEEKRLAKWNSQFLIQPKLDGDRCRAKFDEFGKVTLLSSEENIITSVPHIVDQLEQMGYKDFELDGELYNHGASHQLIHGTVSRTVNLHPEFENISYNVFDVVTGDAQLVRSNWLDTKFTEAPNVKKVETLAGEDIEDVMKALEYFTNDGYEGVVLRHPMAPYVRKRSTMMMKFKPRRDDFYTIIGYEEEISIHGEPKNSLGALILTSGIGETFKVGSGSFLTRDNRKVLWEQRDTLKGRTAHIKYQHLTERHVPRFPVLIDIIKIL